ncbi:hypothetical protein SAMN05444000_11765 [Shimia gijangensis]|uniref:Uncharacterized protein n=1 Tax=Shimia gijangensis TaxID=1470563 RepID=A0A1M6P4P5_9RHOB|nr:hypothetical protein [Shimia gijangensis]SHK02901.1 hypothetical protein SAMN05444000_11765 [Shimia gijangensis]
MKRILLMLCLVASGLSAETWTEPAVGSQARRDMLDAMRPHAEWLLGAPVQFVVEDLRQANGLGYGYLRAQRPGGRQIDVLSTPGYLRGDIDIELGDSTDIHALFQRSGGTWVALQWTMGPSDVWHHWDEYCRVFDVVIRDLCQAN